MELIEALAASFDHTAVVLDGVPSDSWDGDDAVLGVGRPGPGGPHDRGRRQHGPHRPRRGAARGRERRRARRRSRRSVPGRRRTTTLAAWRAADLDAPLDFGGRPDGADAVRGDGQPARHVDARVGPGPRDGAARGAPRRRGGGSRSSSAREVVRDEIRGARGFDPVVTTAPDATPTQQLVAFLGRQPVDARSDRRAVHVEYRPAMRRSIDDALDDHPADEEFPPISWMVGLTDDPERVRRRRAAREHHARGARRRGLRARRPPEAGDRPPAARRDRRRAARGRRGTRAPEPARSRGAGARGPTRPRRRSARWPSSARCAATWSTVMIAMRCSCANSSRNGSRAGEPSSWSTSQITATGGSPARRARSTAASVWPRRSSTPPSRARSGNTWPGRMNSSARAAGSRKRADGVGAVGGADAAARVDVVDRDRERGVAAGRCPAAPSAGSRAGRGTRARSACTRGRVPSAA